MLFTQIDFKFSNELLRLKKSENSDDKLQKTTQ